MRKPISKRLIVAAWTLALVASMSMLLFAASAPATAFSPVVVSYQGYLQKNGGPYDSSTSGSVPITVYLYDGTAASDFWHDTFSPQVSDGHFTVFLGSNSNVPLQAGFFDGSLVKGPIQLSVSVDGADLSGRQVLHPSAYAHAANYANQSSGEFDVGGLLAAHADATVAGNLGVTGTASAATVTATTVTAATVNATATLTAGTVHSTGAVTVDGVITPNAGVAPVYDSGWFYVTSDLGDITLSIPAFNPPPGSISPAPPFLSQLMVLQCGNISSGNKPAVNAGEKNSTCTTRIVMAGTAGFHDDGSGWELNPESIGYDPAGNLILSMLKNWRVWGYPTNNSGSVNVWACTGGIDASQCRAGFYRVLAWR